MNEIRMYVEHLFEGRMLTAENIELKEEIYGNLVARYEDYVAGGMDPAQALEKTKASMTSVDDVLAGEEQLDDGAASRGDVEDVGFETTVLPGKQGVADENAGIATGETIAMPVAGAPIPPNGVEDALDEAGKESSSKDNNARKGNRTRNIIIACAVGFVALVALGLGSIFALGAIDHMEDRLDSDVDEVVTSGTAGEGSQSGSQLSGGQSNDKTDAASSSRNQIVAIDADGKVWLEDEPADDLLVSVVNATSGDIADFRDAEPSDASTVETLIHVLPMGKWATDVDVTRGVDVLSYSYREVPDSYDGESVDIALAYDVAALFCAMPKLNEVRVTLTESDEPRDENYYVFTRNDAQRSFGVMLSGEMMTEAGWGQIKKDHLYGRDFAENMVDTAERAWK